MLFPNYTLCVSINIFKDYFKDQINNDLKSLRSMNKSAEND